MAVKFNACGSDVEALLSGAGSSYGRAYEYVWSECYECESVEDV